MTKHDTEPDTHNEQSSNSSNKATGSKSHHRPQHTATRSETPEDIKEMLIEALHRFCHQLKRWVQFIMVDLGGKQMIEKVVQWCLRNPQTALIILAAGITMLLPFLILVGFGLSTILMTFTGFLVLEGTLLSILSILLVGCLFACAIVLIFFGAFGVAAYFGFAHIYDLFGGTERYRSALVNYLQHESTYRDSQNNNSRNGNAVNTDETTTMDQ